MEATYIVPNERPCIEIGVVVDSVYHQGLHRASEYQDIECGTPLTRILPSAKLPSRQATAELLSNMCLLFYYYVVHGKVVGYIRGESGRRLKLFEGAQWASSQVAKTWGQVATQKLVYVDHTPPETWRWLHTLAPTFWLSGTHFGDGGTSNGIDVQTTRPMKTCFDIKTPCPILLGIIRTNMFA